MIQSKVLHQTTITGPASVSIPTTRTSVHLASSCPLGHHPQQLAQRALLGRGARQRKLQAPRALPEDSTVVDTEWLRRNLEEDIRIFDARGSAGAHLWPAAAAAAAAGVGAAGSQAGGALAADYDSYLEGHVPGAVFVNWTRDGACYMGMAAAGEEEGEEEEGEEEEGKEEASSGGHQTSGGWRRRLPRPQGCGGGRRVLAAEPDPDTYVPCFEARGLSAQQPVVVYDDGGSMTAARVWWSLLLYGHPRPYILAGGWDAWRAGGGGSELYEPCPLKLSTTFEAEPQPQYRASVEEFVAAAERGTAAGAAAGPGTVAVLLLPEGARQGDAGPLPVGLRTVALSELLPPAGSTVAGGLGDAGARLLGEAATVAMATEGQRRERQRVLRARLGSVLGVTGLGEDSGTRLLLASPHDASLSACVVAAVLRAAGHSEWAVCDSL